MNGRNYAQYPYRPELGCLLMLLVLMLLCVMPMFIVDAVTITLAKLHLSAPAAVLVVMGILLGGLVNVPLYRWERDENQVVPGGFIYSVMGWVPLVRRTRTQTILAVNVGGCLVPLIVAVYELSLAIAAPQPVPMVLAIAVGVNVAVCYFVARPIPGVGIALPAFTSPAVALGIAWLLMPSELRELRPAVAFVAGVVGPLVGADLLHLHHFRRFTAGLISIGGAGTFDGIVLSGMLAAFLA